MENALDELCYTKLLSMVAAPIATMIATQHAMMNARIVISLAGFWQCPRAMELCDEPARISRPGPCVRYEGEEFAKPQLLVAPQMPGLGEHAFDDAPRFASMAA